MSLFVCVQDFVVSAADCMTFEEGEMEAALHILASHNGELSPVRPELRGVADAELPFTTT